MAWSPNGSKFIAGSIYENQVYVADSVTGQTLLTLNGHTAGISTVDWSPDGNQLASAGEDHSVRIWDSSTGTPLFTLNGHANDVESVTWNPNSRILASTSLDGTIRIWNTTSGRQENIIQSTGAIYSVSWSPDGCQLAYGGDEIAVQIVNVFQDADACKA